MYKHVYIPIKNVDELSSRSDFEAYRHRLETDPYNSKIKWTVLVDDFDYDKVLVFPSRPECFMLYDFSVGTKYRDTKVHNVHEMSFKSVFGCSSADVSVIEKMIRSQWRGGDLDVLHFCSIAGGASFLHALWYIFVLLNVL
tara:strand:- start:5 stop:427 length:423 start_codon:yes stop_codon:yes gene_type:complete